MSIGGGDAPRKHHGMPSWAEELLGFIDGGHEAPEIRQFVLQRARRPDPTPISSPRVVGHRYYDALIEELLGSVLRATTREEVLADVLQRLFDPASGTQALCYFVIEAPPRGPKNYSIRSHVSGPDRLWEEFQRNVLPRYAESGFLQGLLGDAFNDELYFSHYIDRYDNVFTPLVRGLLKGLSPWSTTAATAPMFWMNAQSLPSEHSHCNLRAVVGLYPNIGSEHQPSPPTGAAQDRRVMRFLGTIYRLLNHQIENVALEVMAERVRLLASLAPGLLNHEIGNHVSLIPPNVAILRALIQRLICNETDDQDRADAVSTLETLENISKRLLTTTDAFNNLEKRRPGERVSFGALLSQITSLCNHRLGQLGVSVDWSRDVETLELETDPALLLHLLLNIVTNALNAFDDGSHPEIVKKRIRVEQPRRTDSAFAGSIIVYNNGPKIAGDKLEKIFQKGFTTRKGGHGQGLYICRLIAQSLGGSVHALPAEDLPSPWTVGFILRHPPTITYTHDFVDEMRVVGTF